MKMFLNLKTVVLLSLIGFYLVIMFSNFTTYEGAENMDESSDEIKEDGAEDDTLEVEDTEEVDEVEDTEEVEDELEVEEEVVKEELPPEARGFTPPTEEELVADKDGDGVITDEEYDDWYENQGGWKATYKGLDYWLHPKFDWSKRERWINNQRASQHWIQSRGGSQTKLNELKEQYPTDFSKKTY